MADRINFMVSAIPIETLTTENATGKDVIASEVNTSLGGGGDSVDLANYSGAKELQGYADGAVYYIDALHTGEGVKLSAQEPADFIFIKNTGHKYLSESTLGLSTTDCVMVVAKTLAFSAGGQSGWVEGQSEAAHPHYFMLAWLKPGQAFVLPGGITTVDDKYDLVSGRAEELCYLNDDANDRGDTQIYVKTFESDGTASSDGNAVEFLVVT